jgi:hypothetical protein
MLGPLLDNLPLSRASSLFSLIEETVDLALHAFTCHGAAIIAPT